MLRFAVLASPDSWYIRDLLRAAEGKYALVPAAFSEMRASLIDEQLRVASGDVDLTGCDAVLVRTMPPGSLEQVVFRMDALNRLAAAGLPIVNSPRAIEAAVDKFLTSAKLAQAGL